MPRDLTPEEIDLMLMNEDWLRYMSWDFYVTDEKGRRKLVTTLEDLEKWLGGTDDMPAREQARKIAWFMTKVPSYHAMPKSLKKEFRVWARKVLKAASRTHP
ncbi:MAG: hypothetical protein ACO2PL_09780 [Armatimonadota bacterium]|jgi:hypothetical protein